MWLLVRNNPYHSAAYFHTSNAIIAGIYQTRANITQYFNLPGVNEELAIDNAQLRELLSQSQVPVVVDSKRDSMALSKAQYNYEYLSAKVINNSTRLDHNFITINKGRSNGVEPGMGVISAQGAVGKVMSVSANFATIASVLNKDVFISALLKRNNTFGSVRWDGRSILQSKFLYVPIHIELLKGDTIVTSSYNAIFPENIPIGYINEFSVAEDGYFDIDIDLSNDFSNLTYVYVVKNPLKEEKLKLELEFAQENE